MHDRFSKLKSSQVMPPFLRRSQKKKIKLEEENYRQKVIHLEKLEARGSFRETREDKIEEEKVIFSGNLYLHSLSLSLPPSLVSLSIYLSSLPLVSFIRKFIRAASERGREGESLLCTVIRNRVETCEERSHVLFSCANLFSTISFLK